MEHTIHSEEYCKKRIKELEEKNKDKTVWSLGDSLFYNNFLRILKKVYKIKNIK